MSFIKETCENCTNTKRIIFECFSEAEKEVISWYISKVEFLTASRAPGIFNPTYIWYIVRCTKGNGPDGIIVNERTMDLLMQGYKFQDSNIISSGFHYFFKAYLRNYLGKYKSQEILNGIYKKYWGYDYRPIKRQDGKIIKGYVVNLKFHGNQKDYHPILTRSSDQNFRPTLIELISRNNDCYEETAVIRAIDSAECLLSRFNGYFSKNYPFDRYPDKNMEIVDPNKVFISMISEYVISNYRFIGNNPASPDVFNAIDNLIGHDCLANVGQLAYPL
ncbi:MAG: hypothetical protein WD512_01590 [Candidatus Paceibacterota bacterium]